MKKCWHWPIFPARRQASIFGSAQLNFCVRNGYRWTLCDSNTNFSLFLFNCKISKTLLRGYPKSVYLCWHWPIFPDRRQSSIFGSAQLNFCVRNGYRWTLCDSNTNCLRTLFARLCAFRLVHLRRLELRTHWLRVSCSTNWARGASVFRSALTKCSLKTEQRKNWELCFSCIQQSIDWDNRYKVVQAFGLLVSVSWMHYCTYTSDLSNL